jgi:hypothetical protein
MIFLCLIVAVVQIDRQSRKTSSLAVLVPGPARSFALEDIVQDAMHQGRPQEALQLARKLVKLRPIPAEHLRALAQAELGTGQNREAYEAIAVAGERGWRDPIVQFATVVGAIQEGNWDRAAQSVAALWAIDLDTARREKAVSLLVLHEEGRTALAAIMATNVPAENALLNWLAHDTPLEVAGQIVAAALRGGGQFDCRSLARLSGRIAVRGDAALAARLWPTVCDGDDGKGNESIGFTERPLGQAAGPFDWTYANADGVHAEPAGESSQKGLSYRNTSRGEAVIASKLTGLLPGPARIPVRSRTGALQASPHLTVTCLPTQQAIKAQDPVDVDVFPIPARDCAAQRLDLSAPHGTGTIAPLVLEPSGHADRPRPGRSVHR